MAQQDRAWVATIDRICERLGISRRQLALRMGITSQYLYHVANRKLPPIDDFWIRLCEAGREVLSRSERREILRPIRERNEKLAKTIRSLEAA